MRIKKRRDWRRFQSFDMKSNISAEIINSLIRDDKFKEGGLYA